MFVKNKSGILQEGFFVQNDKNGKIVWFFAQLFVPSQAK
jgi:hypothetical protein